MTSILLTGVVIPLIGLYGFSRLFKWEFWDDKFKYYAGFTTGISLFISISIYLIGTHSSTSFNECRNFKVTEVRYYEDWDEEVSCRHPIYSTRTVGTGKNTYTETYISGYEHSYDVDYHPKYWEAVTEIGGEYRIDENTYLTWRRTWNNNQFVDMNRSYHSKDGDMYRSWWTGQFEKIYPLTDIYSYENKVRVSKSVFNYQEVDEETKKRYPRPADNSDTSPLHSYGVATYSHDEWLLRLVNAEAGVRSRIHVTMFLFDSNKYSQAETEIMKAAWKGPNKNELVICVGVNPSDYKVAWCDVFSWMDDTTGHVKIRQFIFDQRYLNIQKLGYYLRDNIQQYWKKKSFHDFDYLKIPVPTWAYIVMLLLTVTTTVVCGIVIEKNNV
jgi:hypothetical protein